MMSKASMFKCPILKWYTALNTAVFVHFEYLYGQLSCLHLNGIFGTSALARGTRTILLYPCLLFEHYVLLSLLVSIHHCFFPPCDGRKKKKIWIQFCVVVFVLAC